MTERGEIVLRAGQFCEAAALYREALGKNPELLPIRNNFAVALLRTGDLTEARNFLTAIVQHDVPAVRPVLCDAAPYDKGIVTPTEL